MMAERKPFGSFAPASDDTDPWSAPQISYGPAGRTIGQLTPYDMLRMKLHGAALGAGAPNPDAIDAQRAAQANRPLSDVAGEALSTAAGALPASPGAYALQGARDVTKTLLSPTPASGGDFLSVATDEEKQELQQLNDKIKEQQDKMESAVKGIARTRYKTENGTNYGQDPSIVKDTRDQYNKVISGYQTQMNQIQGAISGRRANQLSSQAPYAQQHPYWQELFDDMPGVSTATGITTGLGALKAIKAGLNPKMAALAGLGLGTGFGIGEGVLSQAIPASRDLSQPKGSPAYEAAAEQMPDWLPESGFLNKYSAGPFLSNRAVRSAGVSGGLGFLGSLSMLAKGALPAVAERAAASTPPVVPTAPAAPMAAAPATAAAPALAEALQPPPKAPMSWAPVYNEKLNRHKWPSGHPYAGQIAPTPKDWTGP